MAAGEADFLLDVGRAEDLGVDYGGIDTPVADIGAEAGEGIESESAHFVATFVPGAVRKLVGDVLCKDAHRMGARRNYGRVMDALEVEFAPEMPGKLAATRCCEARLPFVFGERRIDLAVVVGLIRSRTGREVGQFAQMHVELDGASFDGNAFDAGAPLAVGRVAEKAEGLARVGVGDDGGRGDALSAVEQHAFAREYLGHGHAGDDGGAGLAGCIAEVEGDHAHSAAHVAPHAGHSAQTAGGVVKANGSCAGVEGAGVGADDALAEVGNLEAFVAEVVLHKLGHRPIEEHGAGLRIVAEAVFDLLAGGSVADPEIARTRRAEGIAQTADHVAHGAESIHIAGRQCADFGGAAGVVVPKLNA